MYVLPYLSMHIPYVEYSQLLQYKWNIEFVGTPEELTRMVDYLKSKFEMKDPGKQNFCFNLQIEYFLNKILVYQSTYTKKVLKHFHIGKLHPLSSSMIVRSLEVKNDIFHLKEDNEELLLPEVLYYNVIDALMYIVLHQLGDIGIKSIMYCDNMGLYYSELLES